MKHLAHPLVIACAVLAIAYSAAPLLDNYSLLLINLICVYAVFATGYNILMGYAGEFDFGQAAFLALGAYGSAVVQERYGLHFSLALVCGALVSVVAGLIIGAIVLRLRHFYLALVTLAFSQTVVLVLVLWTDVTHGFQGLPVPRPQLFGLSRGVSTYLVVVTLTVVMILIAHNLVRSQLGRAFVAMRESQIAAQSAGINLIRTRLLAYGVSAFFGGIAGGMLAMILSYITPQGFTVFETIKVLAMIVVGGMGSLAGGVLGAIVLTFGSELLRSSQFFQEIGFGLLLIACIILMPDGIAGLIRRGSQRLSARLRP
ncbi:branched-chain amino acid transport system permease protein [Rhodoligotrophos appendicifer]|uniref:branched-chain amino acid ABC transporter permease n=1 Tax=Rhodoligotrophos appendicifer TaxID=987056 RepID=UPI001185F26E|nr:branched-chain amino acid ABC transporter permease [Rhodoligotrophos appendicifer]